MKLDGFGHEHFSGTREITDALRDAHGQSDHIVEPDLDLAGVNTRAHLYAHAVGCGHNLRRGAHRPCGRIEGGEEPVTDGLDLSPSVTGQDRAEHPGVLV